MGKTFRGRHAGFAATVRSASVAASGDQLLISLRVRRDERKSWFGLGTDANVHVWGRPVLDPKAQVLRLTDVTLDVESEGMLGVAVRAAAPYLEAAVAERTVIDLKPFAANARKSIEAAIAEFRAAGDGVRSMPRSPIRAWSTSRSMRPPSHHCGGRGAAKVRGNIVADRDVDFTRALLLDQRRRAAAESRLCMCTMKAVPNSGVARLRIGIDTKAAMNRPARNTVLWLALRSSSPRPVCGSAWRRARNIRGRAGTRSRGRRSPRRNRRAAATASRSDRRAPPAARSGCPGRPRGTSAAHGRAATGECRRSTSSAISSAKKPASSRSPPASGRSSPR